MLTREVLLNSGIRCPTEVFDTESAAIPIATDRMALPAYLERLLESATGEGGGARLVARVGAGSSSERVWDNE